MASRLDPRLSWALRSMLVALHQMGLSAGVRVTSTLRSREKQAKLYREWLRGERRLPVAPPGRSMHERGLAFDISAPDSTLAVAGELAPYLGLRWLGSRDPVHFELAGA